MVRSAHLVKRFAGSLWPAGPRPAHDAWARAHLLPGEVELWRRMSPLDRRHAAGVARRVAGALGDRAERPVVAAALLHDAGKVESGLGTWARVVATVASMVLGRRRAEAWGSAPGFRRRIALYLRHPALGADLLHAAGADPLTVAWAREHHLPPAQGTLPPDLAAALHAADDD